MSSTYLYHPMLHFPSYVYLIIIFPVTDLSKFDWNKVCRNKPQDESADIPSSATSSGDNGQPVNAKVPSDLNCTQACLTSLRRSISNPKASQFFDDTIVVDSHKCCPLHTRWRTDNVPLDAYLPADVAPKQTSCEIEVDILAADILNR